MLATSQGTFWIFKVFLWPNLWAFSIVFRGKKEIWRVQIFGQKQTQNYFTTSTNFLTMSISSHRKIKLLEKRISPQTFVPIWDIYKVWKKLLVNLIKSTLDCFSSNLFCSLKWVFPKCTFFCLKWIGSCRACILIVCQRPRSARAAYNIRYLMSDIFNMWPSSRNELITRCL